MEVKKLRIDKSGNLQIGGVNAKGRKENTWIAIPPNSGPSRLDIISFKTLDPIYNYGCEDDVIVLRVGRESYETEILWAPSHVIILDVGDEKRWKMY